MRGALSVRINDGRVDRVVTKQVRGLKFSKCADGGHKAGSFTMTLPRGAFPDLGPSDRAYVTDSRTSLPLFEMYLDAPTPVAGPGGEAYSLSGLGGMIRASDETRPLLYVDGNLSNWTKTGDSQSSSDIAQIPAAPGTRQSLRLQLNPGQPIGPATVVAAEHLDLSRSDMSIGAVRLIAYGGKSDGNYLVQVATRLPDGATTVTGLSASDVPFVGAAGVNVNATSKNPIVRLIYTGPATNVVDETTYVDLVQLSMRGRRMTRSGSMVDGLSHGAAAGVYAYEIVEDLLGRLLRFCDPLLSTVAVTTKGIDQSAYPDGATAQRVLDDLGDHEPDYLWEILHSGPGGHVFNYRPWPTSPRYEISTRDGYVESGSDVDLCNRVVVTWTNALGATQTTIRTASSSQYPSLAALESAGRVRDADPASLPDGLGSQTNAERLGDAILADINAQPTAARAVVRRPIRDLVTGAMVMPWEIEPGNLVSVREIGQVLRLTEMEYDDDSCSTSLTLGYPSPTREQRIAQLARA